MSAREDPEVVEGEGLPFAPRFGLAFWASLIGVASASSSGVYTTYRGTSDGLIAGYLADLFGWTGGLAGLFGACVLIYQDARLDWWDATLLFIDGLLVVGAAVILTR